MAAMLNWINRNLDRHIVTIDRGYPRPKQGFEKSG